MTACRSISVKSIFMQRLWTLEYITAADYVMQSLESDIKSPLSTGLGLMVFGNEQNC